MINGNKFKNIFCTSLICVSFNAWSVIEQNSFWNELESNVKLPSVRSDYSSAPSSYSGEVTLLSNQLADKVGNIEGNRFNADIDFSFDEKKSNIEKKVDFSIRYNDAQTTMFAVKEASFSHYVQGKNHQLTYGRQVLKWSAIDANWGFGFLNNRVNFDGFEPGQEGLTGVSWKSKIAGFNFEVFGSMTYVPELNPALEIDNEAGTITSGNIWAKVPAASTDAIGGQTDRIVYFVNMPNIGDIVFRPSVGLNISRDLGKYIQWNAFYIKKPENKLTTELGLVVDDDINITINPKVFYHNVIGTSLNYMKGSYVTHVGLLSSIPDKTADGNSEIYRYAKFETEKIDETYFSAGIKRNSDQTKYGVNYIARVSSYDKTEDLLAQNPRWSQAINVFWQRQFNKDFLGQFDIKFDSLTKDRLLTFRTDYRMTDNSLLAFGVSMIGVDDSENSFWKDFKNNDSVYTSFKYRY